MAFLCTPWHFLRDFAPCLQADFSAKRNILNLKDFNMCAKYDQLPNLQWGLIVSSTIRSPSTDLSTAIVGEQESGFFYHPACFDSDPACTASS
jgi:hypothetical protein